MGWKKSSGASEYMVCKTNSRPMFLGGVARLKLMRAFAEELDPDSEAFSDQVGDGGQSITSISAALHRLIPLSLIKSE
jgi:hypothetical protein